MPKKMMMDIIKENRLKLNLTQEDLASLINVSNKTISKWENGLSYPDALLIPKLAAALNLTINELYDLNDIRKENSIRRNEIMIDRKLNDFYQGKNTSSVIREKYLISLFDESIKNKYFTIYYQPLINSINNTIFCAEALVRWNHPVEGIIKPYEFIPIFEKSELIARLDKYVWNEVIQYLGTLGKGKYKDLSISINVSRADFHYLNVAAEMINLVKLYDVNPHRVKIEITESAFCCNSASLIEEIFDLRNNGFSILMDDFGSGYSSLNVLGNMPIDIIKLDMNFLTNLNKDYKSAQLLDASIDIAHRLCLPIIAEGVETSEQINTLQNMNCYLMQGFYYAKPLPKSEFERFLTMYEVSACLDKWTTCKSLEVSDYRNFNRLYGLSEHPILVIKPIYFVNNFFETFDILYFNKSLYKSGILSNSFLDKYRDGINKLDLTAKELRTIQLTLSDRSIMKFYNVLLNNQFYTITLYPVPGSDYIVIVFE